MTMGLIGLLLLLAAVCAPAGAQDVRERIAIKQTFKGKAITITGELFLPPRVAKVPAMIVHHGSGGVSDLRTTVAMSPSWCVFRSSRHSRAAQQWSQRNLSAGLNLLPR